MQIGQAGLFVIYCTYCRQETFATKSAVRHSGPHGNGRRRGALYGVNTCIRCETRYDAPLPADFTDHYSLQPDYWDPIPEEEDDGDGGSGLLPVAEGASVL